MSADPYTTSMAVETHSHHMNTPASVAVDGEPIKKRSKSSTSALTVSDTEHVEQRKARAPSINRSTHNIRLRRQLRPYSSWDEAYAHERFTHMFASFCWFLMMAALNPLALAISHDKAPIGQLPDVIFSLIDEKPFARVLSDWGVGLAAVFIALTTAIIHRFRYIVIRRLSFITGVMYLLRVGQCLVVNMGEIRYSLQFITLVSTQLSIPYKNATLACAERELNPTPATILRRFSKKFFALG
jgi:hypothetical protein